MHDFIRKERSAMGDNLKGKVSQLGERLKIGGSEVGQKLSARMSSLSFKMKEFIQGGNHSDSLVEEATAETMDGPDWATNLEICDLINRGRVNSVELIRSVKKRMVLSRSPRVQYLSLVLLETIVKNCDKAFAEVAAEKVLDDMVKLIDAPHTLPNNRNKALMMIESWGESTNDLRYLPVYEQTYKSLKARGIRFPGRDNDSQAPIFTPPRSVEAFVQNAIREQGFSAEKTKEAFDVARNSIELLRTVLSSSPQQDALQDELTITLIQQCHESQFTVRRIIETAGNNEALLFEALSVNDDIQNVISKYEDMKKPLVVPQEPERTTVHVAVEPEDPRRVGKEEERIEEKEGAEEEEDEEKEALIRKGANSRTGIHEGNNDDCLAEMVSGTKSVGTSEAAHDTHKKQPHEHDLITF